MSDFEQKIFKDKTFSDILEEIYKNSKKKETQIKRLIEELKPLIENIGDAVSVVPLIKEYLEIGVKNDEHLIKLAVVAQKIMGSSKGADGSGDLLTPEEIEQLNNLAEENHKDIDIKELPPKSDDFNSYIDTNENGDG